MFTVNYPGILFMALVLTVVLGAVNYLRLTKGREVVGTVPKGADALIHEGIGKYLSARIDAHQPIARGELGGTLTINGEKWRAIREKGHKGSARLYVLESDILPSLTALATEMGV